MRLLLDRDRELADGFLPVADRWCVDDLVCRWSGPTDVFFSTCSSVFFLFASLPSTFWSNRSFIFIWLVFPLHVIFLPFFIFYPQKVCFGEFFFFVFFCLFLLLFLTCWEEDTSVVIYDVKNLSFIKCFCFKQFDFVFKWFTSIFLLYFRQFCDTLDIILISNYFFLCKIT